MSDKSENFGQRLKAARTAKHLSQDELGAQIGVRGRTIGRWEREGDRPLGENYERLKAVLPEVAELSEFDRLRAEVAHLTRLVDRALRQLGDQP